MVMKNWYSGHKLGPWGKYAFNSPKHCDVMSKKGCAYKMNDDVIRAVIGQKLNQVTKFDVMQDQIGTHTYYSRNNREWTMMTNYNAAWHFTRYSPVRQSAPPARFRSYFMPRNFDGVSSVGDGSINWEGTLNCGRSGTAGINCYGTLASAKGFNRKPIGGEGCRNNPSTNRWKGTLHWYMFNGNHDTYTYVCNGAQHSSGASMNPRFWIRSAAGME